MQILTLISKTPAPKINSQLVNPKVWTTYYYIASCKNLAGYFLMYLELLLQNILLPLGFYENRKCIPFLWVQRSKFDFCKWYPAGISWEKKLTPNFYAVADGNCMEIWDSIGSYIGSLFLSSTCPGVLPYPLFFTTIPDFSLAKERERKRERERVSSLKENNQQEKKWK